MKFNLRFVMKVIFKFIKSTAILIFLYFFSKKTFYTLKKVAYVNNY